MSGHGTTFANSNPYFHPTASPALISNNVYSSSLLQSAFAMDMNNFHPSLLSYGESSDFEFAAFLHGEDVQFQDSLTAHGLSDSSGRATPPSSDNRHSSSLTASGSELVSGTPTQKQRLERRGHTKSRRGCYNCKRRRIKCQESRPACGHCVKTGLKCEYPSLPQITHQVGRQSFVCNRKKCVC
jgi:hypothetical protein